MNKTLKEFFTVIAWLMLVIVKAIATVVMFIFAITIVIAIFLAAWLIACYNKAKTNFQNYFNI